MLSNLVVLDRDGVLNRDLGFVHKWKDWEWCYRAPEALKLLASKNYRTAILTNQSGVGRGHFTQEDYAALMEAAESDLAFRLQLDCYWPEVVCTCFHHPDDMCLCRKPGTLLWEEHIKPHFDPIDPINSWMVGDKQSDKLFGEAAGLRVAMIPDDYKSLWDFAQQLPELEE